MAEKQYIVSGFIVDKKDLTQDEMWAILLWVGSTSNLTEKWELEISEKYQWINGNTRGEDTGKFYEWLVAKGLDKKIEIVRG